LLKETGQKFPEKPIGIGSPSYCF